MNFDKERAVKTLIEPFKKQGKKFNEQFSHLAYQQDLLVPLKEIETPKRLALLAFLAVLFDTQKESKKHYKEVLALYKKDKIFFTLESILSLSKKEAAIFARQSMHSMAKKGDYLQTSYELIKSKYGGDIYNVLDKDIVTTQKRLLDFKGFSEGLSGLYVHTLRDHTLFTFSHEEDFCPKIDFHDYNIALALGIIRNENPLQSTETKKKYSYFLRDLAKEQGVNIFELDAFLWTAGQLCLMKNDAVCEQYCPLANEVSFPRAYAFKNDYAIRGKKTAQERKADELQGTLF